MLKDNRFDNRLTRKRIYILAVSIIILSSFSLNGIFYVKYREYLVLSDRYHKLLNVNNITNTYYDELTNQYNELLLEYKNLNNIYKGLLQIKTELYNELENIRTLRNNVTLIESNTIILGPENNYTETFRIIFPGYIDVNYTSTGDCFVWVGSTSLEDPYYSRNPQYPQVSRNHSFSVPVIPELVIYFYNPNEYEEITLTYSLNYIY